MQYTGDVEMTEAVLKAIGGEGETDYGDACFFTTPRMPTGDPRYAWVNNVICVGQGRLRAGRVASAIWQRPN